MQLLVVHKSGTIDVVEYGDDTVLTVGSSSFALDGIAKIVLTEQVTVTDVVADAPAVEAVAWVEVPEVEFTPGPAPAPEPEPTPAPPVPKPKPKSRKKA